MRRKRNEHRQGAGHTFYGLIMISNTGSISVTVDASAVVTTATMQAAIAAAIADIPQPIIGTAPPTTSTVGSVGQQYIDKTNKRVWYCTAAEATGYTWISPDKDLADAIAGKQDASSAVNSSNIGSQTVKKAKYATDTIAVGTPALRNQYFVSAEATPTVNGQIAWVYG